MVIRALDRKLLRDFKALRTQTVTTAILVICGVSLLISAWSAYSSLRAARNSYYREYLFADIFGEIKRAPVDLAAKIARIDGVKVVEARIQIDGLVDPPGQAEPAVGRFVSVPSGKQPALNHLFLRRGRLPTEREEIEVAVHEGFAGAHHLNPGDSLSVLIQGHREKVRVVGIALSPEYVYALSPSAPLPDDLHFGVFWMPRRALERLALMSDAFNSISLTLDGAASEGRVKASVDELLKPYGNRGVYGRDQQLSNMFVADEIAQQKVSAVFNPAVFLSIAAFLIHVISSRLIALHRTQIATLKAIGYGNREVTWHYLKLIMLMMLVGAIPGIAAGGALGRLMAKVYEGYFRFPELDFSLSPFAVLLGLAAGVLPGMFGAWASIRAAFRLAPAEAMRPPAPPSYRTTLFDKRSFLHMRLTARGKMLWRNLLLRPIRLTLSIAGVAAAVSLIITAGAWNDMISYLLQTQFQRVQREDLSVSFIKPLSSNALRELAKLEGVLAVEGFRSTPVRIRHLNRKRELVLTGWPEKSDMRQRLDPHLRPIPLPEEGILLSRFFQKSWGLKVGDGIELETLDGAPREMQVKVTGFSDDLVGIGASMRLVPLWRLLGEQPDYNLVTIKADPRLIDRLYIKLKDLPFVASVNLKYALYRGFVESMGTMIRVSTLILMMFALAIAIGIIYNSVRVSFSERSWEMASLRVLGFDRSAVFTLLFGEVVIQVMLSLLPGCLMGLGLTHLAMKLIHTETFGFPIIIEWSTYAQAIIVALCALAFSSLVAYRMVGKINLADALKARD